jgi:hypothetical protein
MTKRETYGVLTLFFLCTAMIGILLFLWLRTSSQPISTNTSLSPESLAPQTSATNWKTAVEGYIPANKPWLSVGKFKGKIIVTLSGKAIFNPSWPPLGPEGYSKPAPTTFLLPGENVFCAIARHGSLIEKVGSYKEFSFASETELFLGPNDEPGQEHGAGYADNSGHWSYKIISLN